MEKTYSPAHFEPMIREKWAHQAYGHRSTKDRFVVMMPPPNVTGTLHIGHALDLCLQDVLTRFASMQGRDAWWQPGLDHAGIATQMMVERQLKEEGLDRHMLGKEGFLKRAWQFKEKSQERILQQMHQLGLMARWDALKFTLEPKMNQAVTAVFVKLFRDGLIYRDNRLVYVDPVLGTVVSDLEVREEERQGSMWFLRYQGQNEDSIVVATTRPETLFGDTAIAVHPEDSRYKHMIGKKVQVPLTQRWIPIVADQAVDPEKGSGAVKITPAHDFLDYEIAQRHDLPLINIMDIQAYLVHPVPAPFVGRECQEVRPYVVKALEGIGALVQEQKTLHTVPCGDRSGAVLQPRLTLQWYVNMRPLAQQALKAVAEGQIRIQPSSWVKVYQEWLENIRPWCISRQLWWGHSLPVWYGPDDHIFVAHNQEEAYAQAYEHYGHQQVTLEQDQDVLDTWFSSALWPFATLGWPEKTEELLRYYPTDVLVTGFDILFFWVARMIMMGLYITKKPPFHTVLLHGLVRDERGQKMSKTKGNSVDPLKVVEESGADVLRLSLLRAAVPGTHIKFGAAHMDSAQRFITKLWNAARFARFHECWSQDQCNPDISFHTPMYRELEAWIKGQLHTWLETMEGLFAELKFYELSHTAYHFVWDTYCDWFIEGAKLALLQGEAHEKKSMRRLIAISFEAILKALHPLVPFVTEAIWSSLGYTSSLISSSWPDKELLIPRKEEGLHLPQVIDLVKRVRSLRHMLEVDSKALLEAVVQEEELGRYYPLLAHWARCQPQPLKDLISGPAACFSIGLGKLVLPLGSLVDCHAQEQKMLKLIQEKEKHKGHLVAKLEDPAFQAHAPEAVRQEMHERIEEITQALKDLNQTLVWLRS